MNRWGYTLSALAQQALSTQQIDRETLHFDDIIEVHTRNSIYTLLVIGKNDFIVYGGWFDRKGLTPFRTAINGCTWGGTTLKKDIIAGCGMRLEFANRVTTTVILKIQHYCNNREN